jgi:glycosyltransferase involved in cell wall biosynthesis
MIPQLSDLLKSSERPTVAHRNWTHLKGDNLGVNLIGPVEFVNGLGTSTRGYLSCIANANIPHTVVPWQHGFEHLSKLALAFPKQDLNSINLVHLNLDLLSQGYLDTAPLNKIVTPNRYNICILYWELASIPPSWHPIIHKFDEIWCASSFMARSISAVSARPVNVVRPALDFTGTPSKRSRNGFGLPTDSFVFFYAADAGGIMGRKNPEAFIRAYIEEFPADGRTCCLVKINNTNLAPQEMQRVVNTAQDRPDVIFLNELLTGEDMSALFHIIDCYVSPHRSEGLGLTILEAMAAEKPVIATQYGGVTDFVTKDTAFPIKHHLIEVGDGSPPYPADYIWAEPEISSLRENMRLVFKSQTEAKSVGLNAARRIHSLFSLQTTSSALRSELERIWRHDETKTL